MLGRMIKSLLVVVALALVALVGYAYLGDLGPAQSEMKKPVVLNAD